MYNKVIEIIIGEAQKEAAVMNPRNRGSLVGGLVLVLVGLFLLVLQLAPAMTNFLRLELTWPFIIIGIGVLFFVGILVWGRSSAGLAVPGSIVTGIGLLLLYQNWSGNWESWAYAWALIPGMVGVGAILTGLIEGKSASRAVSAGGGLILISLILFVVFGFFLGGDLLSRWGVPLLLVVGGCWLLVRNVLRRQA
jgi:hypothetical protein